MSLINLFVEDYTKVHGVSGVLTATVKSNNQPVANHPVNFTINGVTYNKQSNADGNAFLAINLDVGSYKCTVEALDSWKYTGAKKEVTVTVEPDLILNTSNLTKTFGDTDPLKAKVVLRATGSVLTGYPVHFTVNGIEYIRYCDNTGVASLNINLNPGRYVCNISAGGDGDHDLVFSDSDILIKSNTRMEGTEVVKIYSDTTSESSYYQCAVYDKFNGNRIYNLSIKLTINGVAYIRDTDNNGLAKLNIRLMPGTYPIIAEFTGNDLFNGSSIQNTVVVKEDPISDKNPKYITVKQDNNQFMQSHIISLVSKATPDNDKVGWSPPIEESRLNSFLNTPDDIKFTSYEINESDRRVKTATVTTPYYMDLTRGMWFLYILSPYHENFGGQVLSVKYDKNTGLYTYQCQDGRRAYMSKYRIKQDSNTVTKYQLLESILVKPSVTPTKGGVSVPIPDSFRNNSSALLLAGLHPLEDYMVQYSPVMTPQNGLAQKVDNFLSYDKAIDVINNICYDGGNAIDVWFDHTTLCHIDPINLNEWLNTGIVLTHQDLISYQYGFDITNVITGLSIKSTLKDSGYYFDEWRKLGNYFGTTFGLIDPVTTTSNNSSESATSNTNTNTSSTGGVMSGKKHFVVVADNINDYSSDMAKVNKVVNALRAAGHTAESLGRGPNVWQSKGFGDWAKGKIVVFIAANDGGVFWDMAKTNYKYDYYIYMIDVTLSTEEVGLANCKGLKSLKNYVDPRQGYSSVVYEVEKYTGYEWTQKYVNRMNVVCAPKGSSFDQLTQNLVNGVFLVGGSDVTTNNSSSSSNSGTNSTSTVEDWNATYVKALEAMTESTRDLLSFSIRLPLNSTVFKNLHTNQMLFTRLPKEFELQNLERIFKILPTYKVSRSIPYQENRWYVEGVKIKCDHNGLYADIKLNLFPSPASSYSKAIKDYYNAYEQAFNTNNTNTNITSNNNASTSVGEPRLGNDSTSTSSMAAATGRRRGTAGDNENFDNAAKKGYAQKGRAYYNWARQYNSPLALAKALNNMYTEASPQYSGHRHSNAEQTFNAKVGNCWDGCRLVKCCFDAAGFDCVVITGSIYEGGHGWNAIKYKGRWYSFDLLYDVSGKEWQGTNSIRLCGEW